MRAFLRFLVNYHFAILFFLLEILAFILIVNYNGYQQGRYVIFAQNVSGYFSRKADDLSQYLMLKKVNQQLALDNQTLRNRIELLEASKKIRPFLKTDSASKNTFLYISAKVINNSINKQYNYITLDKGSLDGIETEMGVVCEQGAVGVVQSVTDHYALVISLLNRNLRVSAKFKRHNYFGSFEWSGNNYLSGYLNDIPFHVNIVKGDTIVTSGFSAIFPEGVRLGYVTDFDAGNGNFFDIDMKLSTDFKSLNYVYVARNLKKEDKEEIEKLINE